MTINIALSTKNHTRIKNALIKMQFADGNIRTRDDVIGELLDLWEKQEATQ